MKNISFALMAFALLAPMTDTNAQTDGGASIVRTWGADQDFGAWITPESLVYQTADLKSGRSGAYIYRTKSGSWINLSGNLNGIDALVAEQIKTKDASVGFLNEQMARLLVSTVAPNRSKLIDGFFVTSLEVSDRAKIERYKSDAKPQINGDEWVLEFNTANELGGIEHWQVTGRLFPCRITQLSRTVAEEAGFLVPPVEIGGRTGGQRPR